MVRWGRKIQFVFRRGHKNTYAAPRSASAYFRRMPSTVQAWFDELPLPWQEPAQQLREWLLDAAPGMKEEWKYQLPFYSNGRWMCYMALQKGRLVLGFIEGIHLPDPQGLFARTAHKQVRHYLPPPAPGRLPEQALRALMDEAVRRNVERVLGAGLRRKIITPSSA